MSVKSNLEKEFDYDLIDEFLDHFDYINENLEPIIMSLENKRAYANKVNELFRVFHNLKSATGFLKIKIINNLAVIAEDTLEKARKLSGPASGEFIDWLLSVSDQLEIWLNDNKEDKEYYSPLNQKIKNIPNILEAH